MCRWLPCYLLWIENSSIQKRTLTLGVLVCGLNRRYHSHNRAQTWQTAINHQQNNQKNAKQHKGEFMIMVLLISCSHYFQIKKISSTTTNQHTAWLKKKTTQQRRRPNKTTSSNITKPHLNTGFNPHNNSKVAHTLKQTPKPTPKNNAKKKKHQTTI